MAVEAAGGKMVNPFDLKDEDGYFWMKGNLHSHSTNSDGRCEPQRRLDGYVNKDYDYLCISDHHRITFVDTVDVPDDFVLVQGAELHPDNPFGGQRHHFICLGLTEDMDAQAMPPQAVIDRVRAQGGQAWLAHPHWSSVNIARDTLPLHGLSGIEVFNTTCRCMARPESGVHWDDWMEQEDRIYPMLTNDDAHGDESEDHDTYAGWTVARVKERTQEAVLEALATGASFGSTGPEIKDIQFRKSGDTVELSVSCSEAQRIYAVGSTYGTEFKGGGKTFEEATFRLRKGARWVRVEVVGPDGSKAWSNPFDLTVL